MGLILLLSLSLSNLPRTFVLQLPNGYHAERKVHWGNILI